MPCYKKRISFLVYILVILFGISSWIAVNGVWVELPLLVEKLPEGWNLPSYISVIVGIANIGPAAYTVGHLLAPKIVNEKPVVCILLAIGTASCILMQIFWNRTTLIGGEEHGTAFIILQFFISLVDTTSSVVYLPFMMLFNPQYLTALYIGESLSGLLPALVALGQGVGNVNCVNETTINDTEINGTWYNETNYEIVPVYSPPNFSVDIFFIFLIAMMVTSAIAFLLLNFLPQCKSEHLKYETLKDPDQNSSEHENENVFTNGKKVARASQSSSEFLNPEFENLQARQETAQLAFKTYVYLLVLIALISMLTNGVVSSIQTYSTLPYGNNALHWTVISSSVANPIVCCIAFFFSTRSIAGISIMTFLGTCLCGFQVWLASVSPHPPLQYEDSGVVIVVSIK